MCLVVAFTDVTDIVSGLRMVKSEHEIAKHRFICGVVSDVFDELPNLLSTGMTERQAFAAFRAEILRQGADDVPYLVGATGPGGIDDIIRQPTDREIVDGDMLIFDTGSTFDGYFSDFDRNFAFTNPPNTCLLYTSPRPRDRTRSRMPSSA